MMTSLSGGYLENIGELEAVDMFNLNLSRSISFKRVPEGTAQNISARRLCSPIPTQVNEPNGGGS